MAIGLAVRPDRVERKVAVLEVAVARERLGTPLNIGHDLRCPP
ncbi:MAG: hypothetical protein RLZZ282_283 [Verrucomicrobiota bacterium]|jgi:hypothetical protein